MKSDRLYRNKLYSNYNHHGHERGLAMVIVLMASAIAATTTMAVAIRSYNNYVNGTRQSLADRAKEAAESGLNILIESLNQDHPEWLIEPYDGNGDWSINREATGGCRTNVGSNPTVEGRASTFSNGTEGRYKLARYSFHGNNFYGGVGSFEMEGEIRSSENKLLASAKIYQDMSIIAKRCDALPGETNDENSLWPGIFIKSTIQNFRSSKAIMKDTDPEKLAEIICATDCVSGKWNSDNPKPTIGDIELPKSQDPPDQLKSIDQKDFERKVNNKLKKDTRKKKCENFRIPEDLDDDAKWQDSNGTWHVHVSGTRGRLRIKGGRNCPEKSAIKITGESPVRLYLDGDLTTDSEVWIDTTDVNHAADFMILGTPTAKAGQKIDIKGEAPNGEALKTFIWLPTGEVRFQAARRNRLIEGAIWSNKLSQARNRQNFFGNIELRLPNDMPQLVYQRLGKEFGIGQRDYVAQGVTSWRSYGRAAD